MAEYTSRRMYRKAPMGLLRIATKSCSVGVGEMHIEAGNRNIDQPCRFRVLQYPRKWEIVPKDGV